MSGGSSGIGLEIARQLGESETFFWEGKGRGGGGGASTQQQTPTPHPVSPPALPVPGLHGASVAITGRRAPVLDAAVADLQASGVRSARSFRGDVRVPADVDAWVAATLAAHGRLDIVINAAAGNFLAAADALSSNAFRTVLDIDAVGTFTVSRAALPALKQTRGCIVNISATLHYGATWWQAHACAAKAAVDAATRCLALEWGEYGVRVNGIAPGPVAGTAGLTKLAGVGADDLEATISALVPLGRLGDAWDIAMAALYLVSDAGRYVSGDVVVVDGGAWLWRPPAAPRGAVAAVSRGVERASRATGVAGGMAKL